jgi:hypothetical protein
VTLCNCCSEIFFLHNLPVLYITHEFCTLIFQLEIWGFGVLLCCALLQLLMHLGSCSERAGKKGSEAWVHAFAIAALLNREEVPAPSTLAPVFYLCV